MFGLSGSPSTTRYGAPPNRSARTASNTAGLAVAVKALSAGGSKVSAILPSSR